MKSGIRIIRRMLKVDRKKEACTRWWSEFEEQQAARPVFFMSTQWVVHGDGGRMESYIIRVNGEKEACVPSNGKDFTLEELQASVGGYAQLIRISHKPPIVMVVDEDGKSKRKSVNRVATELAKPGVFILWGDVIRGDVLVCPSRMVK